MFTETIKKSLLNLVSQEPVLVFGAGITIIGFLVGKGLPVSIVMATLYIIFREKQ